MGNQLYAKQTNQEVSDWSHWNFFSVSLGKNEEDMF